MAASLSQYKPGLHSALPAFATAMADGHMFNSISLGGRGGSVSTVLFLPIAFLFFLFLAFVILALTLVITGGLFYDLRRNSLFVSTLVPSSLRSNFLLCV